MSNGFYRQSALATFVVLENAARAKVHSIELIWTHIQENSCGSVAETIISQNAQRNFANGTFKLIQSRLLSCECGSTAIIPRTEPIETIPYRMNGDASKKFTDTSQLVTSRC